MSEVRVHILSSLDEETGKVIRELGGAITELPIHATIGAKNEILVMALDEDEMRKPGWKGEFVKIKFGAAVVNLTVEQVEALTDILAKAIEAGFENMLNISAPE